VHGKDEAEKARAAAKALFGSGGGDLDSMPSVEIAAKEVAAGINILDLFARTSLCGSKGEARRLVSQGGAIVNDEGITDLNRVINAQDVRDGSIMLRAGKKRYFRIIVKG
jgi:tyrosyl-tRNA synthetase